MPGGDEYLGCHHAVNNGQRALPFGPSPNFAMTIESCQSWAASLGALWYGIQDSECWGSMTAPQFLISTPGECTSTW
jgi:hypothetical protein